MNSPSSKSFNQNSAQYQVDQEVDGNPEPLPFTGYTNMKILNGVAPLQIRVDHGNHYWVKIVKAYNGGRWGAILFEQVKH